MPDLSAENKSHFLSNISRQAEKLGWFGEGFEKAARLETDIITLTPVEQELLPIILEAADQASPRAEAKGREIRLEGDRGIRVCVDGKWTLEAVFNPVSYTHLAEDWRMLTRAGSPGIFQIFSQRIFHG